MMVRMSLNTHYSKIKIFDFGRCYLTFSQKASVVDVAGIITAIIN